MQYQIKFSLSQKFTHSPIEVFIHNQEQNTLLQYLNFSVYSCLINSKAIQVVTERAKILPIKNLYDFFYAMHISEHKLMTSEARYNEHGWANLIKTKANRHVMIGFL